MIAMRSHPLYMKCTSLSDVYEVKTDQFQQTIQKCIEERRDDWAQTVKNRIEGKCLRSSKASYHQKCNLKFRHKSTNSSVGRPQNESRHAAFLKMIDYMNCHEGDTFTINDLVNVMKQECTDDAEEYCPKFLKTKLLEHFGEDICFLQSKGKPDYIIFR